MQKLFIIAIAMSFTTSIAAQTSDEWLRQKKTEKKYLLHQISALNVYSHYVSKGYGIVKNGLNTIQDISQGDFNLHTNYFTSLTIVNSKVRNYARVADIISMQISMAKQTSKSIRNFRRDKQFTDTELGYVENVINDFLSDCDENLDELFNLIANRDLQMKDDERIQAVDKIYDDMLDKKVFVSSFCNNAARLSIQRVNEEKEIAISKKLNDQK